MTSVTFSPDGRTLATGSGIAARLWEVASGREVAVLLRHDNSVDSVAFSLDGRTLATAPWDRTARLWEVVSGKEIRTFRGHEDHVESVAFSPDGRTLATGSLDKTARLWEVASGWEIAVLRGHEGWVTSVAFSPDGLTLATSSNDNTARLWPLGQRLIDFACARVHELPLSDEDKQRFGIENEWCTPDVSAELAPSSKSTVDPIRLGSQMPTKPQGGSRRSRVRRMDSEGTCGIRLRLFRPTSPRLRGSRSNSCSDL